MQCCDEPFAVGSQVPVRGGPGNRRDGERGFRSALSIRDCAGWDSKMLYLVETRLAAATHTLIADLLRQTSALMAARTLDPLGADPGLWQVYDTVLAQNKLIITTPALRERLCD